MVRNARIGPLAGWAAGLVAVVALLAALAATVGLSGLGWLAGLSCGVAVGCAVALALARSGGDGLGPADWVTLVRAALACAVAAMVAEAFVRQSSVAAVAALSAVALALDAVDGWLARRTRTASSFGARFDGEVDSFLILVLSVYVARSFGVWVLAIGAARYLFALAGWGMPWRLPPRPWRKVVAGTQGVVLTLAAADVLPRWLTYAALVVALALLAESFARDLWWLWRQRRHAPDEPMEPADSAESRTPDESGEPDEPERARSRRRVVAAAAADVLAVLLVWFALVAPNQLALMTPGEFVRVPVEGLVVAALALVLPSWARRTMAVVVGVLLGLLMLLKTLDIGFFAAFDRPFNPVTDRSYLTPGIEFVRNGMDPAAATVVLVLAGTLLVALLVGLPLAVVRLTGLVARHRGWSARVLPALVVAWVALALAGMHVGASAPVASAGASRLAVGQVAAVAKGIRQEQRFEAAAAVDRYRDAASGRLLDALRGKDVLLTFVESYGRSAVQDLPTSPQVRAVLDAGTRRLHASGYSARSAFLTSPTFGGFSWLAHATLQSGLWVDTEQRHDRLLASNRMTLTRAFHRAGWQTYAVQPSNPSTWLPGKRFYKFDDMFDRSDITYHGPPFGWSVMPDQYALSALQRQVLAQPDRPPVMAEIDLTSSHPPWAPIPRMVDWGSLGDGSMYDPIHERAESAEELWRHPDNVPAAYERSIAYSLRALFSFVQRYGDDDLVVVFLGDHQPATVVTGAGASHDVPITILAHDRGVIDRISGWGWQPGLRPGRRAPLWRMDAFRDRFLAAFSTAQPKTQASTRPSTQPPPRRASALHHQGERPGS